MERVDTLTTDQLLKACQENLFIIARYKDNSEVGVNCKIIHINRIKNSIEMNISGMTNYISFRSASFQEYISYKQPFL